MDVHSLIWTETQGWKTSAKSKALAQSQWVLYFGSRNALKQSNAYTYLQGLAPQAQIMGCSTGGEIQGKEVFDDAVAVACITFDKTKIETFQATLTDAASSYTVGKELTAALDKPGLTNIFLLADGLHTNGTDLVRGIFEELPPHVIVTGGLAGDGADFKLTEVGLNAFPSPAQLTAIGFYGNALHIGYGSIGGWDAFGPERRITKSKGSVLYELDGVPALDLYKSYLGEAAKKLPGSALLFPLNIRAADANPESAVVRTIIAVNEAEKSLQFAGDIPEGHLATLMRGNFDNLVEGAGKAATLAKPKDMDSWDLTVLVSCIGRKLLLGQRISDETEAVADILGKTPIIGFYSYGEICHHHFTQKCDFHNQTMTVTLFSEK